MLLNLRRHLERFRDVYGPAFQKLGELCEELHVSNRRFEGGLHRLDGYRVLALPEPEEHSF